MAFDVRETTTVWFQRRLDSNAVARLDPLRRHRPVLTAPPYAVVTRRDDVDAVLRDERAFGLPYAPRLTGPFLLGITGDEHTAWRQELRAVVRDDDLQRLRASAHRRARRVVDACTGSLDVGTELVDPVLAELVAEYLGVAPDPLEQLTWARDLFQDIFLNPGAVPSVRRRAEDSGVAYCRYVEGLIASRPHGRDANDRAQPDDVLQRLLRRQVSSPQTALTDRQIRDSLIGLAIGWLYHGAKAAMLAADELLERQGEVRAALAEGTAGLERLVQEVLRFRPVQPFLLRTCARDTTLAPGTERARRVGVGTTVVVGTHSAMWDEAVVPDPTSFDRSRADAQYLVFGDGAHRCFGEAIAKAQLPALLAPLFRAHGLRRAPRRAGRLRWQGPAPARLCVRLDPL